MDRTTLSLRNSFISLGAQIATLISQFVMQIVFVHTMSANYLGANGLFTNLMNLLSFAELGIGTALTYTLYKPLAERDYDQLTILISAYRRIYRRIGITILLLGAGLAWLLPSFVKTGTEIPHMQAMFYLYVVGVALSYFYSFARSVFIADQKAYINSLTRSVVVWHRTCCNSLF